MDPGTWWGWWTWGERGYGMHWIFPLLCMIVMVAMMVLMFRRGGCMTMRRGPADPARAGRETPRQILDRRLASGEITREQHAQLKRDIDTD